ncbi:MAG: dihydropteroate synthase [Planctomycetes bacterium]|nr:dihydropteroate synthase [Planctomycetota bacterium]
MSTQGDIRSWPTAHGTLTFGPRTLIMGILNVTPDSFSDGGEFASLKSAVARAFTMQREGADLIDIGGESTRPGSVAVPPDVQITRIVPVIRELRATGLTLPISVDTRLAAVAEAALDTGADIINDISAAQHDPAMPALLAARRVPFVAMHMQGTPETMQANPMYRDVVAEVSAFFDQRARELERAGVDVAQMMIDPGIGFGKTTEHSLALLRAIRSFRGKWPVLVGPSRKKFLGVLLGEDDPKARLMGTVAVAAHCALAGVEMLRVHDVKEIRQVVDTCAALR